MGPALLMKLRSAETALFVLYCVVILARHFPLLYPLTLFSSPIAFCVLRNNRNRLSSSYWSLVTRHLLEVILKLTERHHGTASAPCAPQQAA